VRNTGKAKEIFRESKFQSEISRLEIKKCDLGNESQLRSVCSDVDQVIWCATGFTDTSSPLDKVLGLLKLQFQPETSLDISGLKNLGSVFAKKKKGEDIDNSSATLPSIVVCSSAGVTRPSWSDEKKARFIGASDIPIVRLNPFGILDNKLKGEEALRESGADYTIFRPGGLNDDWPSGRPFISQGDLAVGRINRADVASLLVAMLSEPKATKKTFEAISLPQFPKPLSYDQQLSRLVSDGQEISEETLDCTYALMQQCTPGQMLKPQELAMGQTYEQLDKSEEGRLGKRGEEAVPIIRE